ncbi:hypothetical protein HT031_006584 [Scenedesmus sp. PABB004]|nr:hypothetical protein HT031_006584 [Scenedesmus sp. PABB004]
MQALPIAHRSLRPLARPRAAASRPGLALPRGSGAVAAAAPRRAQLQAPRRAQLAQPVQQAQQAQQQERRRVCAAAAAGAGGGESAAPQRPPGGSGPLAWFDRLPPRLQLGLLGAMLFFGMVVIPFLQPTFLYGDGKAAPPAAAGQAAARLVTPAEEKRYTLPVYVPGASELYDFLQDNAMPRKTPDGRTESPGVLRIYLSSMIILALFYACSAALGLVMRVAAAALRAVGLVGPARPPPKPEGEQ